MVTIAIQKASAQYAILASYYFENREYSMLLPLSDQAQKDLDAIMGQILNGKPANSVIDLKTLKINNEPIGRNQGRQILQIVGKVLAPSDASYADQQMPFEGPHSTRGHTHPDARKSFLGVTGPMERLFNLGDRDEIFNRLKRARETLGMGPFSQNDYFRAWAIERFVKALKAKLQEMKGILQTELNTANLLPPRRAEIQQSIKALEPFEQYIDSLNLFRLQFAVLCPQGPVQDRIRLLEQTITDQNHSLIKTLLRLENTQPHLTENEDTIRDLALLPVLEPADYHRECEQRFVSSARDSQEFPFIRWMLNNFDTAEFFNHTDIKEITETLPPNEQAELQRFFDRFSQQRQGFKTALDFRPAARPTNPPFKGWAQAIENEQKAQLTQYPALFLGL